MWEGTNMVKNELDPKIEQWEKEIIDCGGVDDFDTIAGIGPIPEPSTLLDRHLVLFTGSSVVFVIVLIIVVALFGHWHVLGIH